MRLLATYQPNDKMLTAFEINLFLEARVSLSVAEQTQSHHQFGWVLKQVMLLY